MAQREGVVCVVSDDVVLAAGLAAALTVTGWPDTRSLTPPGLAAAREAVWTVAHLVLVADAVGRLPDARAVPAGGAMRRTVAVGGRSALVALAAAAERSEVAAIVAGDQPFPDLVDEVDGHLRAGSGPSDLARVVASLRTREDEARRFARLTAREQEVLGALATGAVAGEIAEGAHVSLATVRSQIRAVLSKLGVSSQLAAVAMAHRSCREPRVRARLAQVHQF
jgi:DNA-binding CsgD family transcriptional regulator